MSANCNYEYKGKKIPTPILLGDWLFQDTFYEPFLNDKGYREVSKDDVKGSSNRLFYYSITQAKIAAYVALGYDLLGEYK